MTVEELRERLAPLPGHWAVKICVHCRNMHDYQNIDKNLHEVDNAASREMVLLATDILDLGPK